MQQRGRPTSKACRGASPFPDLIASRARRKRSRVRFRSSRTSSTDSLSRMARSLALSGRRRKNSLQKPSALSSSSSEGSWMERQSGSVDEASNRARLGPLARKSILLYAPEDRGVAQPQFDEPRKVTSTGGQSWGRRPRAEAGAREGTPP